MTPVALDMSQIHLGKGQGASGRHQECLHSLLENRRVVSAWVPLVHCYLDWSEERRTADSWCGLNTVIWIDQRREEQLILGVG